MAAPNAPRSARRQDVGNRLTWQRLLAVEAAFADTASRSALPAETYAILREVHDRFRGPGASGRFASRISTHLASHLLLLARLIESADYAMQPDAPVDDLPYVQDAPVSESLVIDFLHDAHPGWRTIGLLKAASEPRPVYVNHLLAAVGWEATYQAHLDLVVRAYAALMRRHSDLVIPDDDRARLAMLCRQVSGEAASVVVGWLDSTTPARAGIDAEPHADETTDAPAENADGGERWTQLVDEYNGIRGREGASDRRTARMTRVVDKMRHLALDDDGFDVRDRLNDADRGWRLAAYAYVYTRGNGAYLDDVCRSLLEHYTNRSVLGLVGAGSDNRPFGDYWALLALEAEIRATEVLRPSQIGEIEKLDDVISPRTENRQVLDRILRRVRRTPPTGQRKK